MQKQMKGMQFNLNLIKRCIEEEMGLKIGLSLVVGPSHGQAHRISRQSSLLGCIRLDLELDLAKAPRAWSPCSWPQLMAHHKLKGPSLHRVTAPLSQGLLGWGCVPTQ